MSGLMFSWSSTLAQARLILEICSNSDFSLSISKSLAWESFCSWFLKEWRDYQLISISWSLALSMVFLSRSSSKSFMSSSVFCGMALNQLFLYIGWARLWVFGFLGGVQGWCFRILRGYPVHFVFSFIFCTFWFWISVFRMHILNLREIDIEYNLYFWEFW